MLVNKSHPLIKASYRGKDGLLYVTLRKKELYFPKQVVALLGFNKNDLLHFNNNGSHWLFFKNNKDQDGFPLTYDKGFKISNRALVGMIQRSTGLDYGQRILIKEHSYDDGVYEFIQ